MLDAMKCVFYVFPEFRIRVDVHIMMVSQQEVSCDLLERTRDLYEL